MPSKKKGKNNKKQEHQTVLDVTDEERLNALRAELALQEQHVMVLREIKSSRDELKQDLASAKTKLMLQMSPEKNHVGSNQHNGQQTMNEVGETHQDPTSSNGLLLFGDKEDAFIVAQKFLSEMKKRRELIAAVFGEEAQDERLVGSNFLHPSTQRMLNQAFDELNRASQRSQKAEDSNDQQYQVDSITLDDIDTIDAQGLLSEVMQSLLNDVDTEGDTNSPEADEGEDDHKEGQAVASDVEAQPDEKKKNDFSDEPEPEDENYTLSFCSTVDSSCCCAQQEDVQENALVA